MLRSLLILLLVASAGKAVIWNEGVSGELRWGESMVLENYSLHLADFSQEESTAPMALVELLRDNLTIANRALHEGESFSEDNSVKMTVDEIVKGEHEDEPYASIRLQLPASAEISLLLGADREIYRGGDDLNLVLWIENKGTVDVEDMRITLNSTPALLSFVRSISELEAGQSWDEKKKTHEVDPIKIRLVIPYFPEPVEMKVRAHAEYEDLQGKAYESWGGAAFHILGPLQLHKRIEESQEFGKSYFVVNSLFNSGNRTLQVRLSDSAGSSFRTNASTSWQLNLSPGETKTLSYSIEAKRPGEAQVLPDAEASYTMGSRTYILRSERPMVDVFGPFIDIKRSASSLNVQLGGEVTVSIDLVNNGNKRAAVFFADSIPPGTELISGKANASFLLSVNESRSLEYRLRTSRPGTMSLPPSKAVYRDVQGHTYSATAPALTLQVQAQEENRNSSASIDAGIVDAPVEDTAKGYEPLFDTKNYEPFLLLAMILALAAALSRYS